MFFFREQHNLKIECELVYFDSIICALLSNEFDQKFLIHHLYHDENKKATWYICPISHNHVRPLLIGRTTLIHALEHGRTQGFLTEAIEKDNHFQLSNTRILNDFSEINSFLPNANMVFEDDEFEEYLSEEIEDQLKEQG